MSGIKVDASLKSLKSISDRDFDNQKAALQLEMDRRAALLAAANQITSAPSYPSRGVVTSKGDDPKIPPTGSFFGQQSNLMDEHEPEHNFFTQAGSKNYQDWPAAPLPDELAGLKVPPLGTGPTKPLKSMKETQEAFTARVKAGLLNDLNKGKGGKSHRRRARKAKRSMKARRTSRRSRRTARR
jgi:hypothetical protein